MFGIGFQELVLLSLIGLIVLGPERLPRVANQLGSWLGQARRMTRVMKRQLEDELNFEKEMSIKPPSREPSTQPPPSTTPPPAPSDEDHYSAAQDSGETGSEAPADDQPVTDAEPAQAETATEESKPAAPTVPEDDPRAVADAGEEQPVKEAS